jgi:hypothetical protein
VLRIPDPRILVYAVAAIVPTLDLLPELATDGPSFVLGLQQRCLEAENADERVADLLECAGTISGVLSDSGRFPRARLNLN